MQETLLVKFIDQKLKNHVEPKKKVARGETKGPSKKKLLAASLMLTNDPLKEIAKKAGVSHGFLLVWRTREEFRQEVAQLQSEFIELLSKRASDFDIRLLAMPWFSDFKDISKYSDSLLLNIFDSISALKDNDYSWIRAFLRTNIKGKSSPATVKFIENLRPIFLIFLDVFLCERQFDSSTEYIMALFRTLCLDDLLFKIYRSAGLSDVDFYLFHAFWAKLMIQRTAQSASYSLATTEAKLSQLSTMFNRIRERNWREISFDDIPDKGAPLVRRITSSLKKSLKESSEVTWTSDLNKRVQNILAGNNPWQWLTR